MTLTVIDLARRIDDLVAETSLVERIRLGRELRLDIAREIDPTTAALRISVDTQPAARSRREGSLPGEHGPELFDLKKPEALQDHTP